MTEYGVQTDNLFALLETADEAPAKPKPKNKRKKKSQRGPGKDQPAGAPQQAPKPAAAPVKKPEPQPAAKPQPKPQPSPSQPAKQQQAGTEGPKAGQGRAPQQGGQQRRPNPQGGRGGGSPGGGRPANAGGQQAGGGRGGKGPRQERKEQHREAVQPAEGGVPGEAEKDKGPRDNTKHGHVGPAHGRQFDRQSGTGRPLNENKKGGGGQANWGKQGVDELAAEEDMKAELQADQSVASPNAEKKKRKKKKKNKEEEQEEKKDEIPDEDLKLFDDYLKERNEKAVKLSLPKPRSANTDVQIQADPAWSDAVKLEHGDDKPIFLGRKEDQPADKAPAPKTKAAQKRERRLQAKREAEKKLQDDTITAMFDFSKKATDSPGGGRGRGSRGPRGPRREGGEGSGHRDGGGAGGSRGPREGGHQGGGGGGGNRGNRNNFPPQSPKKFRPEGDAPQFDDSSFPALQVPPPTTSAE